MTQAKHTNEVNVVETDKHCIVLYVQLDGTCRPIVCESLERAHKAIERAIAQDAENTCKSAVLSDEVLLLEHSGCGHGRQIEQLSIGLYPGDKVFVRYGAYSKALRGEKK